MTVYALYKGNDLLSIGTAKEIAKEMNVSVATVYFYQTPSCAKRSKGGNEWEDDKKTRFGIWSWTRNEY